MIIQHIQRLSTESVGENIDIIQHIQRLSTESAGENIDICSAVASSSQSKCSQSDTGLLLCWAPLNCIFLMAANNDIMFQQTIKNAEGY